MLAGLLVCSAGRQGWPGGAWRVSKTSRSSSFRILLRSNATAGGEEVQGRTEDTTTLGCWLWSVRSSTSIFESLVSYCPIMPSFAAGKGATGSAAGRRRRRSTTTTSGKPRARASDLGLDSSVLQEFDIRESSSSSSSSSCSSEDEGGASAYRANIRQLASTPDKPKRASTGSAGASASAALMRARATELEVNALLNHSLKNDEGPGDAASMHSYRVLPNVLTSTTDTGSSGNSAAGGGYGRGALDDEELDAMLSDLVGRRSARSNRIGGGNDDASSLGMSHDETAQGGSSVHDVDVSRISHSSRQSRNRKEHAENASDRENIALLERELQASKQAVGALLRQRTERNEEVAKAMLKVDSLMTEKDALEEERNDLRTELEAMRARLAESDDIMNEQQKLIQHNEAEVQLYEQRTMQIGDELEALHVERDDLRAELVAKCDEVMCSQEKLKAANAEISVVRSENSALQSDLSDKRSESKSSEDGRKAAKAEVAKLRAERDNLRSMRATVDSLKHDKKDLTASVSKKAELIGKLKGDLTAERKQKQASRKEMNTLKDTNAELQSQAESLREENESFKRQLKDLQQSFEDLTQSNADAHAILSELEETQAALVVVEETLAKSEKENECLVKAATEVEEELLREKEQRIALDSKIKVLTQEADEGQVSLRKLKEELSNEKVKSITSVKELEDANAKIFELQGELETFQSDKETTETDYIEILAQLENARGQLSDAKLVADTARTDAVDGIIAFEQRLKEKLEVQLNDHRAALEALQMKHEEESALLENKYAELISSSALEKDKEISTLQANIIDLEQSLQKNIEDSERKEEQMAQELAQVGGWLEKSKQREEAAAAELNKLQAFSEDAIRQSEAAFDQRLKEELEIQRLAYEASSQTLEAQTRAKIATKARSLQEEMQARDAESKKVINQLTSEVEDTRAQIGSLTAEAEEAYSKADRLELEVTTLRESLRTLEKQNLALIKGRERAQSTSTATQTDSWDEIKETASQTDIAKEADDYNVHSIEESLRQTKVELAAALTAFNLSEEKALGSDATAESTTLSDNILLLRALCKFVNSEGPIGDSDLETAWRSLGMLRRSISQTTLCSVAPFNEANEETGRDESDADDDSILRNLTLSFDKAFTALKNGIDFIDEGDQDEGVKSEMGGSTKLDEPQGLDLIPRPPGQETSIIEFGSENDFETEGRLGIVLGRRPSLPNQLEYSIDKSNEEVVAIVKANEEMLAIVPELQMRCDFLENEREVLLDEKEDLLNETLDLLETSRAESEARVAAAISMVRADALAEIAKCKDEYQQLLAKYQESQKQQLEEKGDEGEDS